MEATRTQKKEGKNNKMKKRNLEQLLELKKQLDAGICLNHTGKMRGIFSLSTSVLLNKQCAKNANIAGSICSHCYARSLLAMRKNNQPKLARNTELLTREILPVEVLPTINNLYFRFEAFGDLNNAIQVVNYFNICNKNKRANFALWTKNARFIDQAIKKYGVKKPKNLNIVYSSMFINAVADHIIEKYPFIDKIFTVYDSKYIKENSIDINCGARSCASCLKCYKKNNIKYISEKLK